MFFSKTLSTSKLKCLIKSEFTFDQPKIFIRNNLVRSGTVNLSSEFQAMEPVKHFFTKKFVEAAQHLTPILKASKFRETGVITPEEFVAAGDHLVHHCPTWQWAKGDASKAKSFLPPDKQFITTKNVPCYKRVGQVDSHTEDQEKIIDEDEDGSGGWVDTHHFSSINQVAETVSELKFADEDVKDKDQDNRPLIGKASKGDGDDDDDEGDDDEEAEDMDSFITSGKLAQVADDDDTTVNIHKQHQKQQASAAAAAALASDPQSNILQTRTYDLHITYDTYYQTPRMWLYGYDENRRPLTVDEMYEDISQDHAHKTVTMETHPHIVTSPMASVHPCRHAEVMKRIIETVAEGGCELGVHMYLMIFLKFVQTVMPTMEYDFTHNFVLEKQL